MILIYYDLILGYWDIKYIYIYNIYIYHTYIDSIYIYIYHIPGIPIHFSISQGNIFFPEGFCSGVHRCREVAGDAWCGRDHGGLRLHDGLPTFG